MSLKKLSDNLYKYKNISPPDDYIRTFVSLLLKETIGVIVNKKNIKITNDCIFITTSPHIKNTIFIQKKHKTCRIQAIFAKTFQNTYHK